MDSHSAVRVVLCGVVRFVKHQDRSLLKAKEVSRCCSAGPRSELALLMSQYEFVSALSQIWAVQTTT